VGGTLSAAPSHIRPYAPADLDALYEICLRTGAAGDDASDLVEDPQLLGHLYAAPYGVLEPEHAFVLDDGRGRAAGYVLGALDTVAFEARCEAEWWPPLRARYPQREGGDGLDDLLIGMLHHRRRRGDEVLGRFPSHLHIDLLPEVQGHGWGRRLMATLFDALAADGSPGVHWGVSAQNHRALGFYRHLGFDELTADGVTHTFGARLEGSSASPRRLQR
jgi:ribosomal protein S18 acetylase RimI-like enzyme